jgi:hypothetical protein
MVESCPAGSESADEGKRALTRRAVVSFLFLAAALAIGSPAYPLDDVSGWQATRWGMTETDVKGVLKSLGLSLDPLPASYGRLLDGHAPFKTSVEMAGSHYDAIFLFTSDTRRLNRVVVCTLDFSREHALKLHDTLLLALTDTYGRPGETESLGGMATRTRWIFKTTTVVLNLYTDTTAATHHVTQVSVAYAPSEAGRQDVREKLLGLALLRALGELSRSAR